MLPFPPTQFRWGEARTLTVRAQRPFRPERLVIATDCAPFYEVAQLHVGNEALMAPGRPVPAEVFSAVAIGVRLQATMTLGSLRLEVTATRSSPLPRPTVKRHNWRRWWCELAAWKQFRRGPPTFRAIVIGEAS